jgi:hypothetical protein
METRDKGKFMTRLRRILLTATLATFGTGIAGAIPIVQTLPNTPVDLTTGNFTVSNPDVLTFNTFNTALGTLNDVIITVSTTSNAEIEIFDLAGTTQSYTQASASVPTVVSGGGLTVTSTNTASTGGGIAEPNNPGPNPTNIAGLLTSTSQTSGVVTTPSVLALFSTGGAGTISLGAGLGSAAYSANAVYPGQLFFGGTADVDTQVTVQYDYTIVSSTPEPTTMLLFGSALVGLGVMRKRKKA